MLRVSLFGTRTHLCTSKHYARLIRTTSLASFHVGLISQDQQKLNRDGRSDINGATQAEKEAEKRLHENPHFQKLAKDFASHDHVHLRQSETEENDSIILGSMRHRKAQLEHSHSHHDHSHTALNPMLVMSKEQVKKNRGVRITWIGLAINVGLAIGKFAGGIVFHSQALVADAVHAVSDMVSDFLTLISVGLASNKPTPDYPFGYGKVETVGSLAVSTILAMAGLSIGWSSLCAIVGPIVPHVIVDSLASIVGESHTHSHSITKDVTNVNAAWIAAASIVAKEWIFQATRKIAIQTNSNVLMANAWHHRVDSLTSLVALVTITSGYLFNIQSLDAVGGLIVSGLVIKAGAEGMYGSVKELVDQSLPSDDQRYLDIESSIKEVLHKLVSNNNSEKPYGIKELTVLPSGPNVRANVILETPLQQWDNILGIKEFEIVTDHLRVILYKDIPSLKRLNVEFVEEQPELTEIEKEELAKQQALNVPELETKIHQRSQHDHSHSNFGFGADHTHKH